MSDSRDTKIDAIEEILRNNPDIRPEFKTKLETLKSKFESREGARRDNIESELARQAERKQEAAEARERSRRRAEEFKAFDEEWKDHRRRQADLIRRIAAKL